MVAIEIRPRPRASGGDPIVGSLESSALGRNPLAGDPLGAAGSPDSVDEIVVRDPHPPFGSAPGSFAGILPDPHPGGTRRRVGTCVADAPGANASLRRNLVRCRLGVLRHRSRGKRSVVRPSMPTTSSRMGVPAGFLAPRSHRCAHTVGRHGDPPRDKAPRRRVVVEFRRGRRGLRTAPGTPAPDRTSRRPTLRSQDLVAGRLVPLVARPPGGFHARARRSRIATRGRGPIRHRRQVQEHPMRSGRDDPVVRTATRFLDSHPPSMNQTQGVLHA